MKKIILLSLFFALTLSARENPFSPQDITKNLKPQPIPPKIQIQKPIEVLIQEPQKATPAPPLVVVKEAIIKPKVKKRKTASKPKLIYNGTFAKIKHYKNTIQIITKDQKLQHLKLTHPHRLAFDFERFDVVPPFSKKIKSSSIRHLKVGHHDYFYRMTFNLAKNYRYKIMKKSYGYLIKLY